MPLVKPMLRCGSAQAQSESDPLESEKRMIAGMIERMYFDAVSIRRLVKPKYDAPIKGRYNRKPLKLAKGNGRPSNREILRARQMLLNGEAADIMNNFGFNGTALAEKLCKEMKRQLNETLSAIRNDAFGLGSALRNDSGGYRSFAPRKASNARISNHIKRNYEARGSLHRLNTGNRRRDNKPPITGTDGRAGRKAGGNCKF